MNLNITYGVLITQVINSGPAAIAGLNTGTQQVIIGGSSLNIGGDVIIAINGTRIVNTDARAYLPTYLEENTLPAQTIIVTVVRNNLTMNISTRLMSRPPG
jgi:S1-C subfamily serine protease